MLLGILASVITPFAAAWANDAEIISLIGKGDAKQTVTSDWNPATVKQKLIAGSFVRTREQSQMALLLKDSTQVRLNQQSILNIKAIGTGGQPTRLELPQGRAWSQANPRGSDVSAGKRPLLEVSTPAATAAIRGTDWELVVEPDGTSTLTVLSGAVDLYNDHGRVAVLPNQQARVVPGKAPVRIFLGTAAERVQWVTSYRPQPRRWVRNPSGAMAAIVKNIEEAEYAPALAALEKDHTLPRLEASLVLADMQLFLGQPSQAIDILAPHARDGTGEPIVVALLSRALLIAGHISNAARVLTNIQQRHISHVEILLAHAELGRVQGDAVTARNAAEKVIGIDQKNAEAWYIIGRIETEREYATAAREALGRAIALRRDGPGYKGELGMLETYANEFDAAEAAFKAALEQVPDDYVALAGLGVLQLKRGAAEAALESFLKSGVIEPRYARAWLFSGVAYYQLGERARALEAFEKAALLDDKDPLPHLMRGLAYYDSLDLGKSIEAAREAQVRMPFLKSLNQVLNDQKGSANLGSALAAFGMEEWSQAYAYDSYSLYWAGSHLFLADRFGGTFNKNSELFKGFLSDPSVFGASNRFSSMVSVPGHYGSIGARLDRTIVSTTALNVTANGYSVSTIPFSYFIGIDKTHGDSSINVSDADGKLQFNGKNLIVGLGLRPTHELGIFFFGNTSTDKGKFYGGTSGLIDDNYSDRYRRIDLGLNYKFSPTNYAWFKIGDGSRAVPVSGALVSQEAAAMLSAVFNDRLGQPDAIQPLGRLTAFNYDLTQRDSQWKHTFDLSSRMQFTWGLEHATQAKPLLIDTEFPERILEINFPMRTHTSSDERLQTQSAYVSGRFKLAPAIDFQLDLHYQDVKSTFVTSNTLEIVGIGTVGDGSSPIQAGGSREREVNPRVGFKWQPAPGHALRFATQVWRKPASVSTLAPVDTMGIPLDDQIERAGGKLTRARLQYEIAWDRSTFIQGFVDLKQVKNLDAPAVAPDFVLDQLEKLRNRRRVYALRTDYLEETPDFGAGRVDSMGLSFNRLFGRDYALSARYVYADTRNTKPEFNGRDLPFHPQHYLNLALNWQPYRRVIVGPTATYRSRRYRDEENRDPLSAGWAFGLSAFWESEDKRLSVGGVVDHIHSDKKSSIYRHPVALLQGAYRF